MTNNLPLVSVCIPTYNGSAFIKRAINSVIQQTYPRYEIIISDHNSTDNTAEIAEQLCLHHHVNFKIVHLTEGGMAQNWNHCLQHASGDFIKFLFQDDLLAPQCLAKMMDAAKNADFVYCNRNFRVDGKNPDPQIESWIEEYGNLHRYWKKAPETFTDGKMFLQNSKELFTYPLNKIGEPSTILVRKTKISQGGLFCGQMVQLTDVEWYYRVMQHCKVAYLNQELVSIGLHKNQTTQNNLEQNKADEDFLLYKTLKENLGTTWHFYNNLFPLKYKFIRTARWIKNRITKSFLL